MTDNSYVDVGSVGTGDSTSQGRATAVAQTAKEDAGHVADTAKQGIADVTQQTMDQAKAMTGQAKEHARELIGQTTTQLRTQADEQTQRAAGGLEQLATQVQALLEGRPQDAGPVRDYAEELGDKVQQLAGHLRSRGVDGVIADAGRFARRRPGLFLVGAATAGFLAGRVVKAQRSEGQDGGLPRSDAYPVNQGAPYPTSYDTGYRDTNYPAAGYRSTPGTPPPLPDATTPPATEAIPSVGAGQQYGTSRASEPERW